MSKIYLRIHKLLIINDIQNRKILTFLRAENKLVTSAGTLARLLLIF